MVSTKIMASSLWKRRDEVMANDVSQLDRDAMEALKTAFWASIMNANEHFKYLDYDSLDEIISRAWVGFEPPALEKVSAHRIAAEARGEESGKLKGFLEGLNNANEMAKAEDLDRARMEGMEAAAKIAEKWRDENREKCKEEKLRGSTSMADRLDGAATECNALAQAIRASIGQEHSSEVERLREALEWIANFCKEEAKLEYNDAMRKVFQKGVERRARAALKGNQ